MKKIILGIIFLGLAHLALATDTAELDMRVNVLSDKFEALQHRPDNGIPADLLHKARGIILLDRTKAGFIFAYQGGGGVAMVKDASLDKWSPVAFVKANEASLGFQIGGEQDFYAVLLMTTNATRMLTESKFEFGGEARGTAGDVSNGAGGSVSPTGEQPVIVYSSRAGLYGGAAVKGGAVSADDNANHYYYGQYGNMEDILFNHKVPASEAAINLAKRINFYSEVHDNARTVKK